MPPEICWKTVNHAQAANHASPQRPILQDMRTGTYCQVKPCQFTDMRAESMSVEGAP